MFQTGVLDCNRKLPSGLSTIERFKLVHPEQAAFEAREKEKKEKEQKEKEKKDKEKDKKGKDDAGNPRVTQQESKMGRVGLSQCCCFLMFSLTLCVFSLDRWCFTWQTVADLSPCQ